jgi:PAS domain S-box-containing protein
LIYIAYTVGWKSELDRVQWSYIFPIAAFISLSKREGFCWVAFFFASIVLILFYPRPDAFSPDPFMGFKLRYLMSFSIICAVAFAGKSGIEATYARLVQRQGQLVESEKKYREAYEGLQKEISERRQAQQALAESEEKYRLIFENSVDVIYSISRELRIIDVSPSIEGALGYSPSEVVGKPIGELDLITPESLERAFADIMLILGGTSIPTASYTFIAKDGRMHYAEVSGAPLRQGGEVVGIISVARDITDRKQAEEERRVLEERLHRAERLEALGILAGGVAHDLNNVLGVLFVYTELLLEKIPEESPFRNYVDNILSASENGAAIIQDLLTLARRNVIVHEVVDINSIISSFLKTPVFQKLESRHPMVAFRQELSGELLNIKGSAVHLEKTVMNLLLNAAEAISGSGEITIRTENRYLDRPVHGYDAVTEGEYVVLTVSDTGGGISTADMGKIFEPFYTKKVMRRSGTGLGLAIVWGTVKDHGGYIDVRSQTGKGSSFTLYFPITRDELAEKKEKIPVEQYMGRGESILVVDDTAEQRDIATRILTRLGYRVHAVPGGEEAVEYLKAHEADLLVLDMIMDPGMDGLETYRQVLEINPKQRAIIVSGFSETKRVQEAQQLGAGAYVRKPYLMEKIGVAVRDALRKM